jgi:hypothetical protein
VDAKGADASKSRVCKRKSRAGLGRLFMHAPNRLLWVGSGPWQAYPLSGRFRGGEAEVRSEFSATKMCMAASEV